MNSLQRLTSSGIVPLGVLLWAGSLAQATNIACTPTSINDPTIQGGSPPGCTQVDMQFSLLSPVAAQIIDTADASSVPTDASVGLTGLGIAGGSGGTSQRLQFFQIGDNFLAENNGGAIGEEWAYTFTLGVTDIAPAMMISGVYFDVNNMLLQANAQLVNVTETVCAGTTTFTGCTPVTTLDLTAFLNTFGGGDDNQDQAIALTQTAAVQVTLDVLVPVNGDAFGLPSFEVGFDEIAVAPSVPEPATLLLLGGALAGIAVVRLRRARV